LDLARRYCLVKCRRSHKGLFGLVDALSSGTNPAAHRLG
jgi:hypothetical protein